MCLEFGLQFGECWGLWVEGFYIQYVAFDLQYFNFKFSFLNVNLTMWGSWILDWWLELITCAYETVIKQEKWG